MAMDWKLRSSCPKPLHTGQHQSPAVMPGSGPRAANATACLRVHGGLGHRPRTKSLAGLECSVHALRPGLASNDMTAVHNVNFLPCTRKP